MFKPTFYIQCPEKNLLKKNLSDQIMVLKVSLAEVIKPYQNVKVELYKKRPNELRSLKKNKSAKVLRLHAIVEFQVVIYTKNSAHAVC